MSPHAATFQPALHAILCVTCWSGPSWIDLERTRDGHTAHTWRQIDGPRARREIVSLVRHLDERFNVEMTLTLPRRKKAWGTVSACTVLWCRVEGKEQLARARRFKPLPTIVLQEGASSRRLLIWALDRPLGWDATVRANRRIAYRLGAVQKVGDPDELRIPVPGSCLREGRSRPVPIVVGRLDYDAMYRPSEVVRRLKDPPVSNWWERAS